MRSIERLNKLRKEIKRHDELYYVHSTPEISDLEYDNLLKEYLNLERELGLKDTLSIGAVGDLKKIKHKKPMLSLSNSYSYEEIEDFVDKTLAPEYMVEEKLDGLSLSIIYKKFKLHKAVTRGDGYIGEDVTPNVKVIPSVPKEISRESLEVRGEVVMPISSFLKLNKKRRDAGDREFSNSRNAASGSLRLLDVNESKDRELFFFAYDANIVEDQDKILSSLDSLGFNTPKNRKRCKTIDEIKDFINDFGDRRHSLDWSTDGAVIKVNSHLLREELGERSRSPRWAIAYKYPAVQVETKVNDIIYQIGRTGVITPLAIVEPVGVDGSIISRATLHNFEDLEKKDIRVGDHIFLEKAGDVIPKISSVILSKRDPKSSKFNIPTNCPSCSSVLVKDGAKIFCINKKCDGILLKRLEFFVSKDAMDISGLGGSTIEKLFALGIKYPEQIYDINESTLRSLEGFEDKSIFNTLESIERSKNTTLPKFLFSLGIKHLGTYGAKLLSRYSLDEISNKSVEDLEEIKGIGTITAKAIYDFFNNEESLKRVETFKSILTFEDISKNSTSPYVDKKIAITGTLPVSRDEMKKKIESLGAIFVSSISKSTDYLIAGEKAGSKLRKAEELGVKILGYSDFSK